MSNVYVAGTRGLARSLSLGAPVEEVWRAIATPEGLVRWFAHRAEATPAGFRLEWDRPAKVESITLRLRESKPSSRLSFDWDSTVPGQDTRATFVLTPEGTGTRLVFTEEGFGDGLAWDNAIAHIADGWDDVLSRLPELWPVAPTRTIRKEIRLPGTAADAYRLLTTESELAAWCAPAASFDARRGGAWRLDAPAMPGPAAGRVIALEAGRRIRLFWSWYRLPLAPAEVEIQLTDEEEGVYVDVIHAGWSMDASWNALYDETDRGWDVLLGDLGRYLVAKTTI